MSLDQLLEACGARASEHAPFGARTTYRAGGTARVMVAVEDESRLVRLSAPLAECGLPVMVLGNGSNLLVADQEFAGVVLDLGVGFESLTWDESDNAVRVIAGAALDLPVAARRLGMAGVAGFEWAVGVPGTIGGAAVMNAGGHGSEMAACIQSVRALRLGEREVRSWTPTELRYGYRSSALSARDVVIDATLSLRRGDPTESAAAISEIVSWRREHQPGGANAGSVFANPPGDSAGRLIDAAGLKGHRVGTASVSMKHANFFQLDAGGSTNDVKALIDQVAAEVEARFEVRLRTEVRFVGFESDE